MDTIISVWNLNLSGFTKVCRAVRKNRQSFCTDNSLEFGKACEELSGIIAPLRLTDLRRMVMLRERYAETSAVLLQSGLDEKLSADSMECYCYLRSVQDLQSDRKKHIMNGDLERHWKDQ